MNKISKLTTAPVFYIFLECTVHYEYSYNLKSECVYEWKKAKARGVNQNIFPYKNSINQSILLYFSSGWIYWQHSLLAEVRWKVGTGLIRTSNSVVASVEYIRFVFPTEVFLLSSCRCRTFPKDHKSGIPPSSVVYSASLAKKKNWWSYAESPFPAPLYPQNGVNCILRSFSTKNSLNK